MTDVAEHPLEPLRRRAEDIAEDRASGSDKPKTRRPSWAPALALDGELLDVLIEHDRLGKDDKPMARLWANFADPKKFGTKVRDQYSDNPLHGFSCRGFELCLGEERAGVHSTLYVAERWEDGTWKIREPHTVRNPPPWAWDKRRTIEEQQKHHDLQRRLHELAQARVLEFAGAPDVEIGSALSSAVNAASAARRSKTRSALSAASVRHATRDCGPSTS